MGLQPHLLYLFVFTHFAYAIQNYTPMAVLGNICTDTCHISSIHIVCICSRGHRDASATCGPCRGMCMLGGNHSCNLWCNLRETKFVKQELRESCRQIR